MKSETGFKGMLESASLLKSLASVIAKIVEEVTITFDKNGIEMVAMDSSHVAMLIAMLPKFMFTVYEIFEKKDLNISTSDFLKILSRATSIDKLVLLIKDKKSSSIELQFESKKSKRKFKIKAKDPDNLAQFEKDKEMLRTLESSLEKKFAMQIIVDPSFLEQVVKDSLIISDLLSIRYDNKEDKLIFNAVEDAGELETEIDLSQDNEETGIEVIKSKTLESSSLEVSAKYALNFLEDFQKIQEISSKFKLSLGKGIPLKIESEIGWYCQFCDKLISDGKVGVHEKDCELNPDNKKEGEKKVDDKKSKKEVQKRGKIIFMLAPRTEETNEDYEPGKQLEEEESPEKSQEDEEDEEDDE